MVLARDVVLLRGDQALWFCDQLLSNQVVGLPAGQGAEALLLTPHGRIRAMLRLLNTGPDVLADLEGGLAAGIVEFFQGRVFTTRVTVEDVSDQMAVVSVLGPQADAIVSRATGVLPGELPAGEEHANVVAGGAVLARVQRPLGGLEVLVGRSSLGALTDALTAHGAPGLSNQQYEARRIRGGVVRDRLDVTDALLPQEAALERAVHFSKGCYLGQEAVAMTQRGRIKRRLRHLRFAGPAVVGPITAAGAEVGTVTSAAEGFGIGLVRTTVGLGDEVVVGESTALVEELPGTWSGPARPGARELREALQGGPAPRPAPEAPVPEAPVPEAAAAPAAASPTR